MRFLAWWLGLVAHLVLVMWHGSMPAPALALVWVSLVVWFFGGAASAVASLVLKFKPPQPRPGVLRGEGSPINKEV